MIDEDIIIRQLNRMPYDMIYTINKFLPVSLLKKLRKIHKSELPINYKLIFDLNDYLYLKYIGYDIDIKAIEFSITLIKNQLQESKRKIVNPFSLEYWNTNSISNENVRQEINKREKLIKENKLLYDYFYDKYINSTIHSQNLNIIELN
jgi:hypothetical protein|tara:strand:+ start:2707 stop:3153 length:447 start_codon:yes stop_codon:yes gene_type:complete